MVSLVTIKCVLCLTLLANAGNEAQEPNNDTDQGQKQTHNQAQAEREREREREGGRDSIKPKLVLNLVWKQQLGRILLLAPHLDTEWRRLLCMSQHPHGQHTHSHTPRHTHRNKVWHTHKNASNFSIELIPSFSLIKATTTSEPSNWPLNGTNGPKRRQRQRRRRPTLTQLIAHPSA